MSESKNPQQENQPLLEAADAQTTEAQAGLASQGPEKKEKLSFPAECYSWFQALTFALVLLIVIFTFFGRVIGVDGSSMEPTLNNGDMLLLQCVGYEPQQGDIVVLRKPFADITGPIVKRVIALGGQTVEIDYNTSTLYVDGQPMDEPYLGEPMLQPGNPYEQGTYWVVPEGSIFVMGDNRNASSDSRHSQLGVIDTRHVLGKALFVLLPLPHMGAVG